MSSEVRYKKKDITNLIESGNERELCFLMLYQVYEEGAFSNLVIKKADKYFDQVLVHTGQNYDYKIFS